MLTRHQGRELVLQSLFNLDFKYDLQKKVNQKNIKDIYINILNSLYEGTKEDNFSIDLLSKIFNYLPQIDKMIIESTHDWGIEKTAIIDRNILRISIFEMLFSEDSIPPKVSINEAIELAKTFGHKQSFKFVSGVLGSIYENSGLKEKDDKFSQSKKNKVEEKKIGALPYYFKNNEPMFLMILNIFNKWTLPKGTSENENEKEGLKKILKEKINLEGKVHEMIGKNKYQASLLKDQIITKNTIYYLFEVSNSEHVKIDSKNKGLRNFKWLNLKEFKKIEKYDDMKNMIKNGLEIILNKKK